ncbi:hypothetical protein EV356DRAFT_106466 [Viridothelium virens]|uniref:Uncharacterized protein n=1 Tax=Viridothelium virens TaxID=1048519 RepID=A0A6A6HNE9_VIRVR|nr:hypothetical protein EV356DRAFT_106466 [Viridothelium virens]
MLCGNACEQCSSKTALIRFPQGPTSNMGHLLPSIRGRAIRRSSFTLGANSSRSGVYPMCSSEMPCCVIDYSSLRPNFVFSWTIHCTSEFCPDSGCQERAGSTARNSVIHKLAEKKYSTLWHNPHLQSIVLRCGHPDCGALLGSISLLAEYRSSPCLLKYNDNVH